MTNYKIVDFQKVIYDFPCLPVLIGILSVIFAGLFFPQQRWLIILFSLCWSVIGWSLAGPGKALFNFALPAFAASLSLSLLFLSQMTDPLSVMLHYHPAAYAEAHVTVTDPSLCDPAVGLPDPQRVICRLEQIRLSPVDRWQTADGKLSVVFPDGTSGLHYGQKFTVKGNLYQPERPLLPGSFDYQDHLQRRGIVYAFRVEEFRQTGKVTDWYSQLLSVRDRILGTFLKNIPDEKQRSLTAALLFGCRQGVEPQTKAEFIRSGTIHILTVSGLHVGIFAGAVFLLLILVPFRWRLLLMPLITCVYVLMTGAQMPSLRAMIMLLCWCIPRAFLVRGCGMNSIFLAASLLLLWNPMQIADPGFQYSFLCVFFLVATTSKTSEWLSLIFERWHWIPDKKKTQIDHFLMSFIYKTGSALSGCMTAWLCAMILTLYYQGITVPFALPANLLILPAVYFVYLIFIIGAVPCLIFPVLGKFFTSVLLIPLGIIEPVCSFFGNVQDVTVAVPPVWMTMLGLTALLVLLLNAGHRSGIAAFILLAALGFYCCSFSGKLQEPELVLLYGGNQSVPGIMLSDPSTDFSFAGDLSDYRSAMHASDYLRRRGHNTLKVLAVSAATREYAGGAQYMFSMLPVFTFLVPPGANAQTIRANEAVLRARQTDCSIVVGNTVNGGGYSVKIIAEKKDFSFDIWQKYRKIHIEISPRDHNGRIVHLSCGGKEKDVLLPNQKEPGMFRFALNQWKEQK